MVSGLQLAIRINAISGSQAMKAGPHVVIDCDFEDKMTEGEIRSLVQQIAYCYSCNIKQEKPVHMIITSCKVTTDTPKALAFVNLCAVCMCTAHS